MSLSVSASPTLSQRLAPLTGVRGLCSVIIVMGHFWTDFAPVNTSDYGSIPIEYLSPVTLFFILSGFGLSIFYSPQTLDTRNKKLLFWGKRFARLVPMYYLSLVLTVPAFIAYGASNLMNIVGNLVFAPLLLESFTLLGNTWNPPLWQISAFAFCYLIYPYIGFVRHERAWWAYAPPLYVLPMVALAASMYWGIPLGIVHTWVGVRIPQFIIGCIVGVLIRNRLDGDIETVASGHFWCIVSESLTFTLLGSFILCYVLGVRFGPGAWWYYMIWVEFVIVPVHCLWIYALVLASSSPAASFSPTIRLFSSVGMRKLGDISYSVYVLQWFVLNTYSWVKEWSVVQQQTRNRGMPMGGDDTVQGLFVLENYEILAILAIDIVIALLCHVYVEVPCREKLVAYFSRYLKESQQKEGDTSNDKDVPSASASARSPRALETSPLVVNGA
eukprot:TRINITY_DN5935_c0_g1_i2.p1 TRINITY_DN5935_c0_g1~~TRINITY_DN5935_c0_g1_i2.p1  ORF type:complete len:443 (+),score=64.60 TRINITY_DN5935_c0_g1_i2:365-1693(+)